MLLSITFQEIQNLIRQKTQKDIRLSTVDNQTICASTSVSLPLVGTKEVKVQLRLEDITNDYALLSYNNGLGVDLAIKGVLKYLEVQSNVSYVQGLPNNRIKLQLNQIPKLKDALSKIVIQNLSFTNGNVVIEFRMK